MSYQFSQELRNRIKEYFEKYYALTISEEEADEYLDSLADLLIIFDSMREDTACPQGARGDYRIT